MGYIEKHGIRFLFGISLLFFYATTSVYAQCVVASTEFETNSELCGPVLTSDEDGWYDEDLDWTKLCKSDMFIGPEYAKQEGIGGVFASDANDDMKKINSVFLLNNLSTDGGPQQYGYSIVTAQPKLIHSFCKANETPNNMYVNIGSGAKIPFVSYTVYGLNPGSSVELSFTLSNLLDPTYFDHLVNVQKVTQLNKYITKYNYSNQGVINGNALQFGVVSSDDNVSFNTSYNNELVLTNSKHITTASPAYGKSTTVTHKATVPASGNITFYFYRANDCFQIPIGIDDIKVTGTIKPSISTTGNPCPEQPLRITTKQSYPEGTKFSWKESVTGQTSSDLSFNFVPDAAETDYKVTLEVTMPGCTPAKSDVLLVHSGTCCTSDDGAPMAMTNLFYDDFGNFVSDNTYEWTDRYGTTHTENIPTGQVHTSQSHGGDLKIPFVKAYNIESSGAKLSVPLAGTVPNKTELYNHGVYVVSKYGGYPGGVPYDNSGTQTGGMLQFDLLDEGTQDDFFEIDIDHICTGKDIYFGADFASISDHAGSIEVRLEHEGNVLESEFKYFENGSDGWKHAGKDFRIEAGDVGNKSEVSIKMKVRHYGYKEDGTPIYGETRDYAIDNIIFQVCTPPDVNMESSVSTGKDILDLCTEDVLTLTSVTSDAVKRFYLYTGNQIDPNKKVGYVYQYTFQDPSTESDTNPIEWKTLHQEEVVETDYFDVPVEKYWDNIFSQLEDDPKHEKRIYFRVVVGEYSDLNADQSWKKNSAFSPCRKISISTIPVIAGLNCAACEKVKEAAIISADPTTVIKTNSIKEKEVWLCPGEVAQLTTKPFAPTDPTVMGITVGPDNEPRKYVASWHKGSKNASGARGAGYTPGDETSSYNVTWEDADWYYLLVKDIEFPGDDGQSCWIWDSIHVIANDKPTVSLTDPAPFCEGTLMTEPTKEISDYAILWYADADASTPASEPIVSSVLAANSPKTFYYVVRDEMTKCISDVKEYVVTVNSIPSVDLDGTVSDFCATVSDPSQKSPEATAIPSLPNPVGSQLTINWYTDKAMSSAAATDLSSLAGSLDPYTYYYKVTSAEGCFDTSHIVFKAMPTAVVKPSAEPVCDKTTVRVETTPATASVQWGNGKTDNTFDITTAAEAGVMTVTATATGYCSSAEGSVTADFYESPAKLTTNTVQYLKTEPITDILTRKSDAVTGKTADGTIMWLGQFKDETEPTSTTGASSSTPTPTAENIASTTDETYYYWVFQQVTNPDGTTCQSGLTKLTVMILGAPAPLVSDTVYCLNSTPASLTENAKVNQMDPNKTYELLWYDAMTGGTCSTTPPAVSTATVGETTYYVSQRDANSITNESSRMPVKVTVYDVPAPSIDPVSDYCVGDVASPLATTLTKDEANYLMADRLVWSDGNTTSATFTPNTMVNTTTTYTYTAKQYYKMSSGVECESKETPLTVTVNFTSVPGDATVSFVAAEVTSDNKTFPAITTKNWVEESGYTYYYALKGTTDFQQGAPKPVYDVNNLNGQTENILYSVYRVDNSTNCKSELSTITVTISDALPPIVANVLYCEGEAMANLTAQKNPQTSANKTEADYTLIWYGTTKPSSTTDPGTEGDTYPLQGNAATNPAGEVTTTSYYVAQRDDKTNAVSPAQEIKVIVYPTPLLSISNPPAVCETEVDLASSVALTNEVAGMTYNKTYFADGDGTTTLSSSKVLESGLYGVQYAYDAKVNSGELCKSKIEKISVTVDTLSVLVGNATTCPNMEAILKCEVKTNASNVEYFWAGRLGSGNTAEFTTNRFEGEYGDRCPYTLTVKAGACNKSYPLEVILGEGPVIGTLTLSDPTNTELPTKVYTNSLTSEVFYFCGGPVTVEPKYEGDGAYTLYNPDDTYLLTPPASLYPNPEPFTVYSAGEYMLSFTNGCPTSVTFKLVDAQIALDNTTPSLGLCEGDKFTSSVTVTPADGLDYSIVWKKDDVVIDGLTSLSYTIDATVADNSGFYKVEANRKGCVATTEIGELKVTPTINVTLPVEPVICEGEETELVITNIKPEGTTIQWDSDQTIKTATNSERVTVQPSFKSGNGHQSTYTYYFSARNESCEKNYQVSVKVDEPLTGTLEATSPICEGFTAKINANSYNATTYLWTMGGSTEVATTAEAVVKPMETTAYVVDMTRGTCSAQDQITVVVTTNPKILSMDSVGIRDRQVITDPERGTGVFTYWVDENKSTSTTSDIIKNLPFGSHVIRVVDDNGCTSSFNFTLDPPEIIIPEFFTPNGDGIHDTWIVGKLAEVYPNAIVNIYDRFGKLVAQFLGDDSDGWDGTYNGEALPSTDYWYMIDIAEIERQFTGHFTLIRR
ncbi:MAG: T9SS type B sorting domain-containing protein [Paludibacteraceae bacterium]|nr:T9SS type B sorting domain-containing protein [Paludibacteraceae bacterium]